MAMATFRVNRVLRLRGRPGVFLCGEVLSGVVKTGMVLHWPAPGSALTSPITVLSIDHLDLDRQAGVAETALGIAAADLSGSDPRLPLVVDCE